MGSQHKQQRPVPCSPALGARCPAPARCSAPSRKPQRSHQALLSPQRQRSRRRVVLQAARGGGGGGGSGGGGGRPRCERVTFVVPGQGEVPFMHVTQSHLDHFLTVSRALGFELDGWVSRDVEDLPPGGTVTLVLLEDPLLTTQVRPGAAGSRSPGLQGRVGPLDAGMHAAGSTPHPAATPCTRCVPVDPLPTLVCLLPPAVQVRNLRRAADNSNRAKELQMEAFLASRASADAPGATRTVLPTTPFADADGQVRLGRTAKAGDAQLATGVCCPSRGASCGRCWQLPPTAAAAARCPASPVPPAHPAARLCPSPAPPRLVAQHYVQLDAAVVAGDTVYVGELKTVLGEAAVEDVVMKLVKIRWGRRVGHAGQHGAMCKPSHAAGGLRARKA